MVLRLEEHMTDYLFARESLIGGMARALDLGDCLTVYNESLTPEMADTLAARADWEAVGDDLRTAIRHFAEDHEETAK
jgi:hypothetical protein